MLLVDTGATSHIITDKSKFTTNDLAFKPEKHFVELADGRKYNMALTRGDIPIMLFDDDGNKIPSILKNALHIPSFPQDIFSVNSATEQGSEVIFRKNSSELKTPDGTTLPIQKHGVQQNS